MADQQIAPLDRVRAGVGKLVEEALTDLDESVGEILSDPDDEPAEVEVSGVIVIPEAVGAGRVFVATVLVEVREIPVVEGMIG